MASPGCLSFTIDTVPTCLHQWCEYLQVPRQRSSPCIIPELEQAEHANVPGQEAAAVQAAGDSSHEAGVSHDALGATTGLDLMDNVEMATGQLYFTAGTTFDLSCPLHAACRCGSKLSKNEVN